LFVEADLDRNEILESQELIVFMAKSMKAANMPESYE
jgi:hypothetical protein